MAFNPVLLAAMSDVEPSDAGLASGVVNTSFMMGGALGLAILASLAAARSETLRDAGTEAIEALNAGYHAAFVVGAIFALHRGCASAGCCCASTRGHAQRRTRAGARSPGAVQRDAASRSG